MTTNSTTRPKNRTNFRLWLGARFYTVLRYGLWLFGGIHFAKRSGQDLEHTVFTHATPMLRRLKDVDMVLQHNKAVNLRIAAKRLDGITINPGEVFSYWKAIGKPTRRKGYLKGMVLRNGLFFPGIGGGLCQMSNLIYWMTLHTPLSVIERHRHDYDVFPDADRKQPFGSGATCFYNYGDLMLRNDTNHVFRLCIHIAENDLVGSWQSDAPPGYTYQVYERTHMIKPELWGGFTRHNVLHRKKFDSQGLEMADEYLTENHAIMMYTPLLENSKTERS
ncbi:MAG: VanW family protein [Gracilibacteraceae bacterium]|jgi:vancomycin resistance protein VanW|nr:VanW family protein [Gracilibacteraceae bacterium]